MRWPALYLLVGFAYVLWTFYGSEGGAIMRASFARRGIQGSEMAGIAFSVLCWPIVILIGLAISSKPEWLERHATWFRRQHLDREGMLEPQMPAPRCFVHDRVLRDAKAPCARCGKDLEVVECEGCLAEQPAPDLVWCDSCEEWLQRGMSA